MTGQESSLIKSQEAFSSALAEIAAKDRRRQRVALALTIAMVLMAAAWLAFSVDQVRRLNRQREELRAQISEETKILVALHPFLQKFGWAPDKIPNQIADVDRIGRSLGADDELSRLRATPHPQVAEDLIVKYYPKDLDGNKVRSALKEFGFRNVLEEKPRIEDIPVDDIVFGDQVPPESAKIVAYVLIRAGVEIKGLHKSNLASNAKIIQVIANRIVNEGPTLTVDNIRQMSSFESDPGL